jgi:8-oxo-dGTP pyrophosphatase MutT (NUDIX family)
LELNTQTVTTPPRAAATVVMLRDTTQGLEVLLIKRHDKSDVLGGVHVFPGGKVDAGDLKMCTPDVLDQTPDALRGQLNEPHLSLTEAAAIFVAAARETFEESGILLIHGASAAQTLTARDMLRAGHDFASVLASTKLRLATSALLPWSRWVTPHMPSMMKKRFDTRFFVAAMPTQQTAQHDEHEATASVWLTPRSALSLYWANDIALAPPQIMSLVHLARHTDVQSVLHAAATQSPPTIAPEPFDQGGMRITCYPGDPSHSSLTRALPGPTRLVYRNCRFEPESGFDAFFD